jgi:signal peptidase I
MNPELITEPEQAVIAEAAPAPVEGAEPESEPAESPRRPRRMSGWITVQSLLGAVVVAMFIMTFLEQPFQIPSQSMENTLLTGDYVLVDKVHFASGGLWGSLLPYGEVHRGDVVVFRPPPHPDQYYVKRVIGLPGDHVRLINKQVFVNGEPVAESYTQHIQDEDHYRDDFPQMEAAADQDPRWGLQMRTVVRDGELIVPRDSYFVLGDNRERSLDSRYWGFVPRENIIGRPLLIYWSVDRDAVVMAGVADDKLSKLADMVYYVAHLPRWRRAMRVVQ